MLFGVLFYSYNVGSISTMFSSKDSESKIILNNINALHALKVEYKIPSRIVNKVMFHTKF